MKTPQRSQQASPVRETQPGVWAARLAAAWCVLFGSAHLYWALGGTVGFVAATGSLDLLKQTWRLVVGLWGVALVCLVCLAGALVCLATVLSWGRRVPSWLLRTVLWIGVLLLVRALPTGVQDVLLVTGALHLHRPLDWSVEHWRLAL
jgi:hypothetical protein